MIKVDKGIPVPLIIVGRRPRYPWKLMEIGDSFLLPSKGPDARHQAYRAARQYGFKYTCKTEQDGTRIWRVA